MFLPRKVLNTNTIRQRNKAYNNTKTEQKTKMGARKFLINDHVMYN